MDRPSFTKIERLDQYFTPSNQVFDLLRQKETPGAEVDSSERFPPPKCHPGTRKTLRGGVTTWLTGSNCHSDLFWVIGPAGVGNWALRSSFPVRTITINPLP
ncbi:hypothetical protein P691DRAFT_801011 [Macrolepiota fuliginosa MF-IS2]|uniref:Uncharacterized protein n=1 Tax=Macrolepiota fuliginosa MF-IS2 TaxID=1400762 RepID=A0A9P5WXJ0_9AGAR|nr:hypothetical protein P691DRAFT_801011 [Macrolepiota fuliginosa MF-IS2]